MLTIATEFGEIKSGEIYYKEYHATIMVSEAKSLLHVIWHGFIDPVSYRETMELVRELINEKRLTLYLIDIEYMLNPEIQTKAMAAKYCFPEFLSNPIEIAAIVSSEKYVIKPLTVTDNKIDAPSEMKIGYFKDQQAAYNWLMEQVPAQKELVAA